jgi:glycosyltransferase involved in cell wall biosynthesis
MSAADLGTGVVVYRRTGPPDDIDAIDQYSRRLVDALANCDVRVRYEPGGLSRVATGVPNQPDWVVLQYNPFRYGRAGFAPALLGDAIRLKRAGVPLLVMVHEAWVTMADWRLTLMGLWQRLQLRCLVHFADATTTSTEALAREIGAGSVHLPVASNIPPVPISRAEARSLLDLDDVLAVALFGRAHWSRSLGHAETAIAALAESLGTEKLAVLNLGADAPQPTLPPGIRLISPGRQDERQLSVGLTASDLVLLPFVDGVSTRRGTLMAALAHGRAVVGLAGENTDSILAGDPDAVTLAPVGDPTAFARAAVDVASDPGRRAALGDAGRCLYRSQFDWPVLARRVIGVLDSITPKRATVVMART